MYPHGKVLDGLKVVLKIRLIHVKYYKIRNTYYKTTIVMKTEVKSSFVSGSIWQSFVLY